MHKYIPLIIPLALVASSCHSDQSVATLKDHFKNDFLIGAAIPVNHVKGLDPKADSIVSLHFNTIVAENCMKSEKVNPAEGVYFWDDADAFVDYGERKGMTVIGHTLIWHSQLAPWFPLDSAGNYVSPEILKERMHTHITTMVSRYKGRVKGWDVVNEAILDDGSYRPSPFYDILGEEFIPLAFQYAHEADPDAELYINDFSMASPGKRERYVKIVNDLRKRGLRVDGIGMQAHIGMDYPEIGEFEKSIEAFANAGVQVMITEWDITVLPTVFMGANVGDIVKLDDRYNPYPDGLPEDVSKQWNDRVAQWIALFKRHSDVISRVNLWGTYDGMSWRNDWPMIGRTDYPLAFDRNYELKPAFKNELLSQSTTSDNKK